MLVSFELKAAVPSLRHDFMWYALQQLGVDEPWRSTIRKFYRSNVQLLGTASFGATVGIRQGCPLSPYLFILFMTMFFHDVKRPILFRLMKQCLPGFTFDEIQERRGGPKRRVSLILPRSKPREPSGVVILRTIAGSEDANERCRGSRDAQGRVWVNRCAQNTVSFIISEVGFFIVVIKQILVCRFCKVI